MKDYHWNAKFKVEIEHLKPPESLDESVQRKALKNFINGRAHAWINKRENLELLLKLIFKEEMEVLKTEKDEIEALLQLISKQGIET